MEVIYIALIILRDLFFPGIRPELVGSFCTKLSTSKNLFVDIGWLPDWISHLCPCSAPCRTLHKPSVSRGLEGESDLQSQVQFTH